MARYLRFLAYDEDDITGTTLGEVTDATQKSIVVEYNGTGAGEFTINRHSTQVQWCRPGRFIRVWITPAVDTTISGDPVFGFFVEKSDNTVLSAQETGGEVYRRTGRGPLSVLEDAIVWHEDVTSNDAATPADEDAFWHWTAAMGAHLGGVMVRMLEEALDADRGCWADGVGTFLTYDFDRTDDSNSDPWTSDTAVTDFQLPIGIDLLRVAGLLMELGLVFVMDPDFTLHAYEEGTYGLILTDTIVFTEGVNIAHSADQQVFAAPNRSTVLVQGTRGDNGATTYVEADSAAGLDEAKRRKEGYLEAGTTTGFDTLTTMGLEAIYRQLRLKYGPTLLGVHDDAIDPFVDYNVGDAVTVDVPGVWNEEGRQITSIGLTDTDAGDADVVVGFDAGPQVRPRADVPPTAPCGDCGCSLGYAVPSSDPPAYYGEMYLGGHSVAGSTIAFVDQSGAVELAYVPGTAMWLSGAMSGSDFIPDGRIWPATESSPTAGLVTWDDPGSGADAARIYARVSCADQVDDPPEM